MSQLGTSLRLRDGGFTLIELMVALGILALATTLVVPLASRSRAGVELRSTAHEIAADLRNARAMAQRTNTEQALVISVHEHKVWVPGAPHRSIPQRFGVAMEIPEAERMDWGDGLIRFFPDGSASGGELHLRDGGKVATVSVNWLNGDVRVHWSR